MKHNTKTEIDNRKIKLKLTILLSETKESTTRCMTMCVANLVTKYVASYIWSKWQDIFITTIYKIHKVATIHTT